MKFRKKPVVIEAFRVGYSEKTPLWFQAALDHKQARAVPLPGRPNGYEIHTQEGTMVAEHGDWIIQGVKGEIYPCKPDIFEWTYERVD